MTLTRSLRQRRNRATSSARDSLVVFTSHCLVADGLFRLPFSKVGQKLFGRNKERILVRDPADDDKRMCPDDVNYGVAAELLQTTCADDRIAVTAPHMVHAGFEFNQTFQVGAAMCCPIHPANDATQWKPAARTARGQLFEHLRHPVLIETTVSKVSVCIRSKLKLACLLRTGRIDTRRGEAADVLILLLWIHYMNRPVATLEPVLDEWEQNSILFLIAVEQRTHMSEWIQLGTGRRNRNIRPVMRGPTIGLPFSKAPQVVRQEFDCRSHCNLTGHDLSTNLNAG